MKKIILAGAVMALASTAAQADLLFTVGAKASVWDAKPTGQLDKDLSVESDGLNLKSDNGTQLSLYFEHSVPIIPNIKLKQTDLKVDGKGTINASFADTHFDTEVASEVDLTHTDITLYWGLPVPFIDLNYGLTARIFDGDAEVSERDTSVTKREKLDLTLPMLYGEVKVNAPFGLYAGADINWIGFGDNKLLDSSIAAGYNLPIPVPMLDVGLEVGYRALTLETDKKDVKFESDLDVKGVFYGLSASLGF